MSNRLEKNNFEGFFFFFSDDLILYVEKSLKKSKQKKSLEHSSLVSM